MVEMNKEIYLLELEKDYLLDSYNHNMNTNNTDENKIIFMRLDEIVKEISDIKFLYQTNDAFESSQKAANTFASSMTAFLDHMLNIAKGLD